jgi:hypothetical protein
MRSMQTQELAAVSGGCYQDSNGDWFDIFYDPTTGVSWPTTCKHPHVEPGTPSLGNGGGSNKDRYAYIAAN